MALKADAVLFLTHRAKDCDREAAKILARCDIEVRQPNADAMGVEVLVRADHDTISEAKSSDAAGRIENALRRSVEGREIRMLQWVEESRGNEPRPAGNSHAGSSNNDGSKPRFDKQGHDKFQSPAEAGTHPSSAPPQSSN